MPCSQPRLDSGPPGLRDRAPLVQDLDGEARAQALPRRPDLVENDPAAWPALPAGTIAERELSPGGGSARVLLARRAGELVVVRLAPRGTFDRAERSELAVLARLAHPGLARLVDHGSLADGTRFVVRAFVEGRDLASWWRARRGSPGADEELGAVAVRLLAALDHLHARGFVHGDLKPENVIVGTDGAPVLTDFGFAGQRDAERGAAGTPFYAAPEVLRGAPASAAIDLFALGATLVRALVPRELLAADLYARFPSVPFLEALGVAPEEIPAWARDVVLALVERDPAQRGRSAGSIARTLAGRLGLPAPRPRVDLDLPVLAGRAEFVARLISDLGRVARPIWVRIPASEDAGEIARALRLEAAVAGVDTCDLDLERLAGLEPASAELDARAADLARDVGAAAIFCGVIERAGERGAVAALARAVAARGSRLVVTACEPAPAGLFSESSLPALSAADVDVFVRASLEAHSDERAVELARALAPAGSGTREVRSRLARAVREGWILAGDPRPRLRAGRAPRASDLSGPELGTGVLDAVESRLATALAVLGARASVAEVAQLADLDLARLFEAPPWWFVPAVDGTVAARIDVRRVAHDAQAVRALCVRRAQDLARAGADAVEIALLELAAVGDRRRADVVLAEAARARETGSPARALDLARRAEDAARLAGWPVDERFALERAFAWIGLGEPERARAEFDPESPRTDARAEAARHALRAALCSAAGDANAALTAARRAAQLDPAWRDAATDREARALYDAGDDAGLERLATGLGPRVGARTRANAHNLVAASLQRRGEIQRARELFRALLDEAESSRDVARAAALSLNLGMLERRVGDLTAARALFEHGAALHAAAGTAAGLAHAQAQLAGVLRDAGELARATDAAHAALELAERLADPLQSAVARGAHGLILADRGHLHAADEELRRASGLLTALGRRAHAALLDARREEIDARAGRPAGPAARERVRSGAVALDADPRVLCALARAAWMRGDIRLARDRARRAADLAASLGQEQARAEGEALAAALRRDAPAEGGEDVESLLSRAVVGAAEAALAETLALRGRDDRAARAWAAIAALAEDRALRARARVEASRCFALCARGLSAPEVRALRGHLLARPDPRPADLNVLAALDAEVEDEEMDVVRLLEINQRLVDEDAPEGLLGAIVEHALAVTGAQRGFVVLEEDGELVFDTARDSRRGDIDEPELEVSQSVVLQALERGTPLRFSNAVEDPELAGAPSVANLDLRSILCVPFTVDATTRGVVYVDNRVREGAFGPRAERLLSLLAGQAALAIRQVRRLLEIRRLNARLGEEVAHTRSDLETAREALRVAGVPGVAAGIVGRSPAIRRVHERLALAARSSLPVLISGASGTGKELAARALHVEGPRAAGPFVVENCAALPASLFESELFGAARGAFTGALVERAGLFERADGGTLFLDEIGELPLEFQAKLLRVLESSEVRRLGEARVRHVDFRLVVATNRDLEADVRAGRFRADLYYRLDGLRIEMPSLAQRVEDVPLLVEHFLRLESARGGRERRASPEVVAALSRRAWPGNVRELRNEVARLLVLRPGDLDDVTLVRPSPETSALTSAEGIPIVPLAELERLAILRALEATGGDKTRAAEILGISRAKVYQRIQSWRADAAPPE